jgi:hypothetical protein
VGVFSAIARPVTIPTRQSRDIWWCAQRTRPLCKRFVVLTICFAAFAIRANAQPTSVAAMSPEPDRGSGHGWSLRMSLAGYFIPDDDDYVQPTVAADRGPFHLESRYNYEGRDSVSGFVGWNITFGRTVTFQLTPMFGVVAGDTDGVVPALELDLTWRRLEFYSEGEYVIDLDSHEDNFLYNWSEASLWMTGWLRAGLVTQRTRVYQTPRDIQRGALVGLSGSRVDGAVYFFNPGADDHFFVASIGVTF